MVIYNKRSSKLIQYNWFLENGYLCLREFNIDIYYGKIPKFANPRNPRFILGFISVNWYKPEINNLNLADF